MTDPGALRLMYQGVALAPRLVLHVAAGVGRLGWLGACVPAHREETEKSAREAELPGR